MAITIDRTARDALYEEVLTELTGSGDVWAEMQAGDYDAARRTRDRLLDDMRLLDDIGWEPDPDRELFELTMDAPDLARALRTSTTTPARRCTSRSTSTRGGPNSPSTSGLY